MLFVTKVTKKVPHPTKTEEYHELFLKNKHNEILKALKTAKNPNKGDIKSVTVRHPKADSNLLKPVTQSDIKQLLVCYN